MTLARLIKTHLCPLLLIAAMAPLAACGGGLREDAKAAPPPPPAAVAPPEPVEAVPTVPERADRHFDRGVTKVGLLLPLSGRNAALGQAMLDAAQLSLFDIRDPGIVLVPRDTETQGVGPAAQSAIEDGAKILLGPIFADAIRAAAPVARHYRIPLVGFSTDRSVAGNGVYILGFTPQQQVDRIVGYAAGRGWKRLAALVPQSPYGDMVKHSLQEAAARYGGTVVATETFVEKEEALSGPVERLAARKTPVQPAAPLPPPAPGTTAYVPEPAFEYQFDAVLIAAGGGLLKTLAPMLPYYDIDPARVKFLGTGLWDDASLKNEPALAGALYAGPSPETGATFANHYRRTYEGGAPRVASLAYDAVALAAALKKMNPEQPFTYQALNDPKGFAGIDGVFRFGADGVAERGLAVIQITPSGASAVEMAPREFGQPVARP